MLIDTLYRHCTASSSSICDNSRTCRPVEESDEAAEKNGSRGVRRRVRASESQRQARGGETENRRTCASVYPRSARTPLSSPWSLNDFLGPEMELTCEVESRVSGMKQRLWKIGNTPEEEVRLRERKSVRLMSDDRRGHVETRHTDEKLDLVSVSGSRKGLSENLLVDVTCEWELRMSVKLTAQIRKETHQRVPSSRREACRERRSS